MVSNRSQSTKVGLSTLLVISVCVVDSVTMAYDGSVMGSINVMSSYLQYFDITTTTKAVNSTATHLGGILIAPFTSFIVDKRGRKESILISALFNIIGAAITGAAQNITMFIAGRIVIGLGVGLAQVAASSYVSETTAPRVRAFALGMYFSCWALGGFLAAIISFGSSHMEPSNWAWRIPSLLQGLAPLLVVFLVPFLPESPRWLINNERLHEGLEVLASINGAEKDSPEVQVQYQEIIDTLNYEKTEGKSLAFREVIRNAPNRKRLGLAISLAPLAMLSGSNVITYYYGTMLSEAGITSPSTQLKINMVLCAWQFLIAVGGSLMADKLGRRRLCLTSLSGCTVLFFAVGAMTSAFGTGNNISGAYGTVATMFLYLGFYSFGLTPLTSIYPPEVLSYSIRATGMSIFTFLTKVCGIFVTMVFPYMFDAIGWKTYMVNGSWNILFVIGVYLYWVETKDKTLEEIDVLFDGIRHSSVPTLKVVEATNMKDVEAKFQQIEIVHK